jgi:uncharacterized protein YaaN involved in tellurite resistance
MKVQYSKAETNVDKIVNVLETHQITLLKDVALLDQMYDLNLKYYKEWLPCISWRTMKRVEETRAGRA